MPIYPMEEQPILNTTIEFRAATDKEMIEVWGEDVASFSDNCVVIVLGNGDRIFPSRDYEGNGPGVFFGLTKDGKNITFS